MRDDRAEFFNFDAFIRGDDNHMPRRNVFDVFRTKPQVKERDALARGGKEGAVKRVTERLHSSRVARDEHMSPRVHESERVTAVDFFGRLPAYLKKIGVVRLNRRTEEMRHDLRVGFTRETRGFVG